MIPRLPLSRFRALATNDPDVAIQSIRLRQPCSHTIWPGVKRNWHLTSNAYVLGDVTIVASSSEGYSIDGHPDQRVRFALPLEGDISLDFRKQRFEQLGNAEAFFINHDYGVMTFKPGSSLLLLTASAVACMEYLSLIDCPIDPTVAMDRFAGLPNVPGLDRLRRAVMHTVWEIDEGFPSLANHELFKKQKEQSLLLQIASVIAAACQEQPPKPTVHARTLRLAMSYVKITPPEMFSYAGLAKFVGASLRSVQLAFRAELNTTIRDWVRDYRLDLAREALRRGDEGGSVTMIALQCGFPHVGRFSAAYFLRFGEYPSETARRRHAR